MGTACALFSAGNHVRASGIIPTPALDGMAKGQAVINITDHGAIEGGTTLCTVAINSAITQCAERGGGQVMVPAGTWLTGTIVLKSNVELQLAKGAILLASTAHSDFPGFNPVYRSHKDINGFHALIYAEDQSNIAITGSGTIDGQGKLQKPRQGARFRSDRDGRPRNILLISCSDIRVEGITMLNSGVWNQHYLNCEDVLVDRIQVYNHSNRNNDGIDIDGCRRFVLSNSTFDTDDDAICLKSTGMAPCEQVLVTNCIASSHCNAIKTGTESTGGFKHVTISNCSVKPSANKEVVFGREKGITGITVGCVDGGLCEDINISNIIIEGTQVPIFVRLGKRNRPHTAGAKVTKDSTMKNISISNITATGCGDWGCSVLGLPDNPIGNLKLHNIRITFPGGGTEDDSKRVIKEELRGYPQPTTWGKMPAYGLFVRNTDGLKLQNIQLETVKPDQRPPLWLENINGLTLSDLTTPPLPDGTSPAVRKNVTDTPPPQRSLSVNNPSAVQAANALCRRLLGDRADVFVFEFLTDVIADQDTFEIDRNGDGICIRGNSALAMTGGLNWYLKYYAHCHVSQLGNQLNLPDPLPQPKQPLRKAATFQNRPFYNYCTFGYTMPWWSWGQWEKEIDWLALNGVNLPLVTVGQEAVWLNTLSKFGMSEEEVLDWLVPPSHTPWMYMGNMESYGRPVPQHWVTSHVELGQQILNRMRELGMTPIQQGYYGNVPSEFKTLFPEAAINDTGSWGGHKRPSTLDPTDPLFAKIADVFYQEQAALFGKATHYQADLFHEDHAKKAATGLSKGAAGRGVFDAMLRSNPDAIWVMQAWIDTPHKEVILGIPEAQRKQLLVVDLYCETYNLQKPASTARWLRTDGFWGVDWCWASINYFGGRMGYFAKLDAMNEGPFLAKTHKLGGNLTGLGAVPESTEQNHITFDLAFEPLWRGEAVNLRPWVADYQARRYGKQVASAAKAWDILYMTAYRPPAKQKGQGPFTSVICARPIVSGKPRICCSSIDPLYSRTKIETAAGALLAAADELRDVDTYQYDVVDITRQMLATVAFDIYNEISAAYHKKDLAAFDKASAALLELILDEDTLLGTRPEFMMSRWVGDARAWGTTDEERAYYEEYAKTLLTIWCEKDIHHDYACREWNGLMKEFYYPRWKASIAQWRELMQGRQAQLDIRKWEHNWCKDNSVTFQKSPQGDPVQEAIRMYRKWATASNISDAR